MSRPLRLRTPFTLRFALCPFILLGCSGEPTQGPDEGEGYEEIVYVSRQHTVVDGESGEIVIDVAGGMGQVMDHGRYVPGARIEVRNLATGKTRNILEGDRFTRADVEGMDLHFDATRIVFSMKIDGDENYHVFTANLTRGDEEDNPYGIRQLTFGAHDDIHPVWAAGNRIAFVTTQHYTEMGRRADEYNHARAVPQIGTITEEGGDTDRKLCSQNLSNTFNLFSMQSGQLGFSRWEHLENINDAKLFAMNPDCTQMVALSGQHGKADFNSLVQVVETQEANVFLAVATSREATIQGGALLEIDARSGARDDLHDEERAVYEELTPEVPKGEEESPVGRYRTPSVLPDGRILVSWSGITWVNDRNEFSLTPPDWGLYVYNPATHENEYVYNDESTWELYARAVAPRAEPPLLSSVQDSQDTTLPMRLGSIDIRQTSLGELHGNTVSGAQFDGTPIDEALRRAVKVRIIEGFSSEAVQDVNMFGLTMAEGAALLGEAQIRSDGSWAAEVPPFVPYHLQAVDEFDLAIRNQTTWIQGMPGEDRICGGCHEERTGPNFFAGQQLPASMADNMENFMLPISERIEYPWARAPGSSTEIQQIFNAKCVSCHNETTNGSGPQEFYTVTMPAEEAGAMAAVYEIPRMDLTDRPITVTYDNDVAEYPASYVSIFYPAALAMEMGDGATVEGTIPPAWGMPSDARNSALIEKLNIVSSVDAAAYAWPLGAAFSNPDIRGGMRTDHAAAQNFELTREERVALIRAIDMGGQYWARQNGGFVPMDINGIGGGENPGQEY